MRLKPREISIALTRPGYFVGDDQYAPVADLPLPANELLDLLEKARVHDELDAYKVLIDNCRKEYLHTHLTDQTLNLMELNHLANVLVDMDDAEEDVFEGFIKMWKEDHPAPIQRIINLALSAAGNPMAYGIFNDEQLGKMSFENDFFEKLSTMSDDLVKYLDYAKLGCERRLDEGGIFTRSGYVPMLLTDEEIDRHYTPGSFPQLEYILPTESLRVQYYRYDLKANSDCEGSITEDLPISIEWYQQILSDLSSTEEELTLIPKYCIIPSMMEYISNTEPLENLNALAVCLDGARAMGKLPLYKALLEATECESVEDAAKLGCRLHEYRLDSSITDAADYAKTHLASKLGADEASRIAKRQDLREYGQELAESKNVVVTDYGYLSRHDGGPILALANQEMRPESTQQAPHYDRDTLVAKSNKVLEQNYRAYMAHIAAMTTEAIVDEALTIAATKPVYDQLTDPNWPDSLYEAVLQCDNPLFEVRDPWLEQGNPTFSDSQFNIWVEDFVERHSVPQTQQMDEQSM